MLSPDVARDLIADYHRNAEVILPYLRGNDLLSNHLGTPTDYVIDFQSMGILEARSYSKVFARIEEEVLPFRQKKASEEYERNQAALSSDPDARQNFNYKHALSHWWMHHSRRVALREVIYDDGLTRYIITSRTNLYQIFEFICPEIIIADGIQAFSFEDDFSFGILQSRIHCSWWRALGGSRGTLNPRPTYVPNIFETFPFPQFPSHDSVKAVADASKAIQDFRRESMKASVELSLREMYRLMEQLPGKYDLRDLHAALDQAVLAAYGFDPDADLLEQLLALNFEVAAKIEAGEPVTAPGIPPDYPNPAELVSDGCIQPPELI